MMTGLGGNAVTLRPATITLVGSEAAPVARHLTRLRSLWPAAVERARSVQSADDPIHVAEAIGAARRTVATLDLSRDLAALGARLDAADTGLLTVTHFVVYGYAQHDALRAVLSDALSREGMSRDTIVQICVCGDSLPTEAPTGGRAMFVAALRNSTGHDVGEDERAAAVALFLFLASLPQAPPEMFAAGGAVRAIGAAGLVGPAGEWLRPAASDLSTRLLALQAESSPAALQRAVPLPIEAQRLVDAMAAPAVLARLFDPQTIEAPRTEALPLNASLVDGSIVLSLRDDAVIIDLPEDDHASWRSRIRAHERALLGVAVPAWSSRVRTAGEVLAGRLPEELRTGLDRLMRTEPHGPWWAERIASVMAEQAAAPVRAQARPVDRLQPALDALRGSLATRPNVVALWLRTAIVLVAASAFAVPVIGALYSNGWRDVLPWLSAALLAGGGIAANLAWLGRVRQRWIEARRSAVGAVGDAAAARLGQEIAAALETARATFRREIGAVTDRTRQHRTDLRTRSDSLRTQAQSHREPATLRGSIAPERLPEVVSRLAPDIESLLERAVRDGAFSQQAQVEQALLDWCTRYVEQQALVHEHHLDPWSRLDLNALHEAAAPLAAAAPHDQMSWCFHPLAIQADGHERSALVGVDVPVCAVVRVAPVLGSGG